LNILYATTLVDKRSRYIGPLFGLGWVVLYPFLFLGLYAVVYALLPQIRLERFAPFENILIIFRRAYSVHGAT
jgi:lipopolysaccharide transport system permease protein